MDAVNVNTTTVISPLLLRSDSLKWHLLELPNKNNSFLSTSGHLADDVLLFWNGKNQNPNGLTRVFVWTNTNTLFSSACNSPRVNFIDWILLILSFFNCVWNRSVLNCHTPGCVFFPLLQTRLARGGNRFSSVCCLRVYPGEKVGEEQTQWVMAKHYSTLKCHWWHKFLTDRKWDWFPLPWMDDCVDRVGPATCITKSDLLKGYLANSLSPRASDICDPRFLYDFRSEKWPVTLQHLTQQVLGGKRRMLMCIC